MISNRSNAMMRSCFAAIALAPTLGSAALIHRYDFEADANDSVGTAHGTIYGSATISTGGIYSGGSGINGTLNAGVPSNGVGIPGAAVSGITGSFTVEAWIQAAFGGGYTTAFSFSNGTTGNYLLATPARGNAPYASTVAMIGAGGGTSELQAAGRWSDNNELIHMIATYDGTNLTYYQNAQTDLAGFNTANTLSATINNPGFNLSTLTQIGINGGAPWPDSSMNGRVFDFRIYDSSLNAGQVSQLFSLGSNATNSQIAAVVPEPATVGLLGMAAVGLLRRRRVF
ncbi:MAG: LamG-like jellyroll fold domain-containing protein [Verrucomicrobiota bacterium]